MPSIAYKNAKAAATIEALNAREEHRRAILAARQSVKCALARAENDEERQVALRRIERSQRAWRTEQRYQICLMQLEGYSTSQIAARLGMSAGTVGNVISKARRKRTEQTAQAIDLHRAILLERSEMIIEKFAPIALDRDLFARVERGEPVESKSMDRALRSAMVMLAVMDFRCRLLGLYPGTIRGPRSRKNDAK